MDELSRLAQDLEPTLSEGERNELIATGMRLQAARPIPAPAFRGDLRRYLLGQGEAPATSRPAAPNAGRPRATALRVKIIGLATSGLTLLGVSALGLAGIGPFAA